jgi:hypothetical protein
MGAMTILFLISKFPMNPDSKAFTKRKVLKTIKTLRVQHPHWNLDSYVAIIWDLQIFRNTIIFAQKLNFRTK